MSNSRYMNSINKIQGQGQLLDQKFKDKLHHLCKRYNRMEYSLELRDSSSSHNTNNSHKAIKNVNNYNCKVTCHTRKDKPQQAMASQNFSGQLGHQSCKNNQSNLQLDTKIEMMKQNAWCKKLIYTRDRGSSCNSSVLTPRELGSKNGTTPKAKTTTIYHTCRATSTMQWKSLRSSGWIKSQNSMSRRGIGSKIHRIWPRKRWRSQAHSQR